MAGKPVLIRGCNLRVVILHRIALHSWRIPVLGCHLSCSGDHTLWDQAWEAGLEARNWVYLGMMRIWSFVHPFKSSTTK